MLMVVVAAQGLTSLEVRCTTEDVGVVSNVLVCIGLIDAVSFDLVAWAMIEGFVLRGSSGTDAFLLDGDDIASGCVMAGTLATKLATIVAPLSVCTVADSCLNTRSVILGESYISTLLLMDAD